MKLVDKIIAAGKLPISELKFDAGNGRVERILSYLQCTNIVLFLKA